MLRKLLYGHVKNFQITRKLNKLNTALLYHAVGADKFSAKQHANTHYVSLDTIVNQIRGIQKRRTILEDEEFFNHVTSNPASNDAACLSFDDGYLTTWNTIIPLLEELKIPSVFYINSSTVQGDDLWRDKIRHVIDNNLQQEFINFAGIKSDLRVNFFYQDSKDPQRANSRLIKETLDQFFFQNRIKLNNKLPICTTEDLRSIKSYNYVKLGNHSHSHYVLSTLSEQEQLDDIKVCQQFLHTHFPQNKISTIFSTPFGGHGTYNGDTIRVLQELGFKGAFTSGTDSYLKGASLKESVNGFILYKRFLPKDYYRVFLKSKDNLDSKYKR